LNTKPVLRVSNIYKSFNETSALEGITFVLTEGEIMAFLGPSGCGKSTLLAIIAGIEMADSGEIFWRGLPINDTPPHRRGFGLMFQDYVLFPHMSVYENVAFGLKMSGMDSNEIQTRVTEIMTLVGLDGFGDRDVSSLSGGEQQRVALGRSLAPHPDLLMLDEPLGSVDRNLRERLIGELRKILRRMKQTAIYVTHDQEEAFAIADRVILMHQGIIEQIGRPEEIYRHPNSLFVANFLGLSNLIPGTAVVIKDKYFVETAIGKFPISEPLEGMVTVLIRPDSATLDDIGEYKITGRVVEKTFRGNLCEVTISCDENDLEFYFLSNSKLPGEGKTISLSIDPYDGIQVFKLEQEES
jgi:ABC-type Fe3+/spermidine/putrescine transport system ATPase subunit